MQEQRVLKRGRDVDEGSFLPAGKKSNQEYQSLDKGRKDHEDGPELVRGELKVQEHHASNMGRDGITINGQPSSKEANTQELKSLRRAIEDKDDEDIEKKLRAKKSRK